MKVIETKCSNQMKGKRNMPDRQAKRSRLPIWKRQVEFHFSRNQQVYTFGTVRKMSSQYFRRQQLSCLERHRCLCCHRAIKRGLNLHL